jgi:hypothetical protein
MIRPIRQLSLALGIGASVLVAGTAHGSQAFPSVVQKELDMPCAPSCTLCHLTDPGQSHNYTQRFALLAAIPAAGGLPLAGNESKLKTGLQKIKAGGIAFDTDSDGTSDYDELKEGNDPNKPGDSRLCGPSYGCGAHIAKAPAKNGGAWVLAACAAALVTFGFRRRAS